MADEARGSEGKGIHVLGCNAVHQALGAQGCALGFGFGRGVDDGNPQQLQQAPALGIVLTRDADGALGVLFDVLLCTSLCKMGRKGN